MTDAKPTHTPLPWRVCPVDDTRVIDALGMEVASIDGDYNQPDTWPVMEANAALIVNAVNCHADLLAVAKRMLDYALRENCTYFNYPLGSVQELHDAIAKAEGREKDAGT